MNNCSKRFKMDFVAGVRLKAPSKRMCTYWLLKQATTEEHEADAKALGGVVRVQSKGRSHRGLKIGIGDSISQKHRLAGPVVVVFRHAQ